MTQRRSHKLQPVNGAYMIDSSNLIVVKLLDCYLFGSGTDLIWQLLLLLLLLLLFFFLLLLGQPLKKPKALSFQIGSGFGITFGRIVLQVNTHRLTVGFLVWCHNFKMVPMTSFQAKRAAVWWVPTQPLPGAYAAASVSSWFIVHMIRTYVAYLSLYLNTILNCILVTVSHKVKPQTLELV